MSYHIINEQLLEAKQKADGVAYFRTPCEALNARLYEVWRLGNYPLLYELMKQGKGCGESIDEVIEMLSTQLNKRNGN